MKVSDILMFLQQVTQRRQWVFVAFVVVGVFLVGKMLIYWPDTKPVRLPGSVITLKLPCVPKALEVRLDSVSPGLIIAGGHIQGPGGQISGTDVAYTATEPTVHDGEMRFVLAVISEAGTPSLAVPQDHWVVVNIHVGRATALDVLGVASSDDGNTSQCPTSELTEKALQAAVITPGSRLRSMRLTQEIIGDLTIQLNESVGNVLLAAMSLAVFWVMGYLIAGFSVSYILSDDAVRSIIAKRKREVRARHVSDDIIKVLEMDFVHIERRLGFARTVGPALGFVLTVSSLIAALHPTVQMEQDAFSFVSSLQLAMTATLVGLLIRIVAEFAIRLHRNGASRKVALIADLEDKK